MGQQQQQQQQLPRDSLVFFASTDEVAGWLAGWLSDCEVWSVIGGSFFFSLSLSLSLSPKLLDTRHCCCCCCFGADWEATDRRVASELVVKKQWTSLCINLSQANQRRANRGDRRQLQLHCSECPPVRKWVSKSESLCTSISVTTRCIVCCCCCCCCCCCWWTQLTDSIEGGRWWWWQWWWWSLALFAFHMLQIAHFPHFSKRGKAWTWKKGR